MKNSLYFFLALPLAIAQNNNDPYRDGLVSALQNANLNTLAAILQNLGNFSDALNDNRTHTVFAPSDSAFNTVGINSSSLPGANSQTMDLILYHILQGNANSTSVGNGTAPFRTLLGGNNTDSVKLPGNNSQVVILGPSNNGGFQIIETQDNATVTGNTTYQNLVIDTIDHVLTIPGTVTSTVSTLGLSSLASAAAAINPSLPANLDNLTGITLFAPSNAAFDSFSNNLKQLNSTQIANVLENHILNGSVVYSSQITDGKKVTSGSGETLQFTKNSTGIFVQSANTTARVTRADVLTKNGVIHLIDQVLVNTDSNPSAASSAASSASSAARTQTSSQTGPVSTGSGGSKSGAESIKGLRTSVWLLVGSVIGGAIVLL